MPRWSAVPSLGPLAGTVLLGALTLGPTPASANAGATDAAAVAGTPDPGGSPSLPPDESPTPTPTGGAPSPSASPTPPRPVPSATAVRPRPHPQHPMPNVTVTASNAVLDSGYWRGEGDASFTLTLRNTGAVAAAVRIDYSVPDGVSDAATGACAHGHCSVRSVAPDASLALPVAIAVSPDAWRRAPLTGQFTATATAEAAGARSTGAQGTWGVVFPPGPPASGIGLRVDDVTLDGRSDVPGRLGITLTNNGALPAAARLDVLLPHGVGTGPMPAYCADRPDPATARCLPGSLAPGEQKSLVVPLTVDAAARADAPLTGLVRATLTAAGQQDRAAQASYQILVPARLSGATAYAGSSAVPPAPPRPAGGVALESSDALAWSLITGGTAVLIGVIGGLVLRRRRSGAAPPPAGPAGARPPTPATARPHKYEQGSGAARPGCAPVPEPGEEVRPDRAGPAAPVRQPAAGSSAQDAANPPEVVANPPEVVTELAEVAAELAEVAAILAGTGGNQEHRPA